MTNYLPAVYSRKRTRSRYRYFIPALCNHASLVRLRAALATRSGLLLREADLQSRQVLLIGTPQRDLQLRAFLADLGFPAQPAAA